MTRLLLSEEAVPEHPLIISGEELHYLSRVRRHRPGDTVELRTPSGKCFLASVEEIGPESARLHIERESTAGRTVHPVHLIVAVPKGQLLDEVVRMAGELGVERLSPVLAERTVARPKGEKLHRWERIAESSVRQSGRAYPLRLDPVRPLIEALEKAPPGERRILHPTPAAPLFADTLPVASPISVAVGPEGGFTDAEIEIAAALGYRAARLDTPILRIETAAVAAAVLCCAGRTRSAEK